MEKQPFENYQPHLFPRIEAVGRAIGRVASLGHITESCLSEHKRGAAAMLDAHLDKQPELPFGDTVDRRRQPVFVPLPVIERPDAGQLTSRWDDMGTY